jgi:pimeloyl-ACP methyl ester carboxylesterase
MDVDELQGRVAAAAAATARLATTLPDQVAALVLDDAMPRTPRLSGTLAGTGRVEGSAVVFGSRIAYYGPLVHARHPWVDDAVTATGEAVADLTARSVDGALALI